MITLVVLQDFILFSLIEAIIYTQFFNLVCKCKKFNIKEILFIGLVNCLISTIIPPILFQVLMVVFMGCYIFLKKNKTMFKSLLFSLCGMTLLMVIEMSISIISLNLFSIDLMRASGLTLFIYMIPIRILELCVIDIFKEVI